MSVELKIPNVGESVSEALIQSWLKKVGDYVEVDEPVAELETDKVTLELPAPAAGVLSEISAQEGDTVKVGDVIGQIDDSAEKPEKESGKESAEKDSRKGSDEKSGKKSEKESEKEPEESGEPQREDGEKGGHVLPAARRILEQAGIDPSQVKGTGPGGRVLKEDAERAAKQGPPASPATDDAPRGGSRREERVPMSPMRRRIAERLVSAQQGAALLTTFNEIDMSAVMALRKQYQDEFVKRHEIKLGFMSFFVKASIDALRQFPQLNAEIDEQTIVYRDYYDIGIAVSTDRGLLVPIVRNAEQLGFAEIELAIADFGTRARDNKIKLDELTGGTFTISNGGIFGSLLSTPIVNPPQSGVLGLHAIQERPVAIDGEIVIRPMMYVALTYDHRIVDGREAVTFLRRIKEAIENPTRMLLEV